MPIKMVIGLEDLDKRIDKKERQKEHKNLANVEFLSNATFFGKIKKANHEYAKNSQGTYFKVKSEEKNKIPIVTKIQNQRTQREKPSQSNRNLQHHLQSLQSNN
jgi:hypothetical protein